MDGGPAARTPPAALLGLCLIPVLFHIAIVVTAHRHFGFTGGFGSLFRLGFVTVSALTHWGIYISLLATFGLTLRPGHDALITAMARKMHGGPRGEIAPELAIYTRRVTIAWCCFFAVQLTISVSLFCFAPLVVWSFFVNIMDLPLVAAMFTAEYLCRLRCLADPPRHSLAVIMKMIGDASGKHVVKQVIPVNGARHD